MIRRTLLQGAAGALVKPVNAPRAVQPTPGVQPGSNQPVVVARIVIVSGVNGGMFLYNGTPAKGNSPVVWSAPVGTTADPYGNALPANGGVFSRLTSAIAGLFNGQAQFWDTTFVPDNKASVGIANAAANGQTLELSSGNVSADIAAILSLASDPVNPQIITQTPINAVPGASKPTGNTIIQADTWQAITPLPANWTALGKNRYTLLSNNSVRLQLSATIGAAAISGTINIATVINQYIPANTFRNGNAPGVFANGTPNAATFNSRIQVTNAGIIQVLGFPGGAAPGGITEFEGQWDYPLD